MPQNNYGVINAHEAYTKQEVLNRIGISQKTWDTMIANGLPSCFLGHCRWVTGAALIAYIDRMSSTGVSDRRKSADTQNAVSL